MILRWPHGLAILALFVIAFVLGRFSARTPDEHLEVVETKEESVVEEVEEEVVEETTEERVEERVRIVYRDRWRSPAGEERETEVELDAEAARFLEQAARVETRVELREVEIVREVEVDRFVRTPLPDWRVGALIGVDLSSPGPAYGLTVERRILGPIHVGAWGLSTGPVGISVGAEW